MNGFRLEGTRVVKLGLGVKGEGKDIQIIEDVSFEEVSEFISSITSVAISKAT